MSTILAADPGLRACGVSIWVDGILTLAVLVSNPLDTGSGPKVWLEMARAVQAIYPLGLDTLVVELQQKDNRAFNPESMFELAGVTGALVGAYDGRAKQFVGYKPRTWSRLPKDIRHARLKEQNVLSKEEWERVEQCPKTLEHNLLDSICLGLYHLKETRQRGFLKAQ